MIMASTDANPIIKVLIPLHPGMDAMDFVGPVEVLDHALHNSNDKSSKAFECTFVSANEKTTSQQGISFAADITFKEAYAKLADYDILIIPGGSISTLLKQKAAEPLGLITKFSALQQHNPEKERTLMSVCTGALLLAQAGILHGLTATTHPDYITKFEILNGEVAQRDLAERCDIVEERYVVNNLRFDLGDPESGKYIRRKSDARRPSMGRKGSNAWRESNTRRESNARRAGLRLGGLRVITSGGITSGLDAGLYLVSAMVSEESAEQVEKMMGWEWRRGVVVDGLDI